MPVVVSCSCGKKYRVGDDAAGKKIRCKECDEMITVPRAKSAAPKKPKPADDEIDWDDLPEEETDDDFGEPAAPPRKASRGGSSSKSKSKQRPTAASESNPVKMVGGVLAIVLGLSIAGFAIYDIVTGGGARRAGSATVTGGVIAGVGWRWLRNKPAE